MAEKSLLTLKINICPSGDCKSLSFSETTGSYNQSYNSSGWPTFPVGYTATLTITDPNNILTTIDLSDLGFPTNNPDYTYPISAELLTNNTTGAFADGLYQFTYTAISKDDTSIIYSTTARLFIYCNIECCVYKMLADIDNPGCDCETEALEAAIKAYNLLQGLKYAASCGLTNSFNEIYEVLSRLCNNSNCKTCR